LVFVLAFLPGLAQVPIADSEMDPQVRDIVAGNLGPVATADHPGEVAIAVYIAGRMEFFNYGLADQARKRAMTSDSLFNIASLRKVLEATLVALGTLRRELRLDAIDVDIFPGHRLSELLADTERLALRHLQCFAQLRIGRFAVETGGKGSKHC
jgi:CubicO group peptidase (beta-lactamase class C family)